MAKKKKAMTTAPATPAPASKGPDGNATTYLIALGIVLALFAGTVILLLSTPQGRQILGKKAETPAMEQKEEGDAMAPKEGDAMEPEAEEPRDAMGLPEGGQVELVNTLDADNVIILDQKLVWRTAAGDTTLVESVNALLPALPADASALYLFARPTSERRVYFTRSCNGPCDAGGQGIIAFDPDLRAFIPLLNVPDIAMSHAWASPNQRRIAYLAGVDADGEARELWVYDLPADRQTRLVLLPAGESLSAEISDFDGASVPDLSWIDPTRISYKVYRAGGRVPSSSDGARTPIATRTATIAP